MNQPEIPSGPTNNIAQVRKIVLNIRNIKKQVEVRLLGLVSLSRLTLLESKKNTI